jgi:hypothetical protein
VTHPSAAWKNLHQSTSPRRSVLYCLPFSYFSRHHSMQMSYSCHALVVHVSRQYQELSTGRVRKPSEKARVSIDIARGDARSTKGRRAFRATNATSKPASSKPPKTNKAKRRKTAP